MAAPPKAEAAAATEVETEQRGDQRHPVVDRPDEHGWGDHAAGPEQEAQATTTEEPVRRGPSVAVIGNGGAMAPTTVTPSMVAQAPPLVAGWRPQAPPVVARSPVHRHSGPR